MFNPTFVDMSLSMSGCMLSIKWKGILNNTYTMKIKKPYRNALIIPFFLSADPLVK